LEAEREKLLKQVRDTTLTVQKVSDVVDIEGNVWWKIKMFDAELKNAGHVSRSKMVNFIMDQGSKMNASLKAMKVLIASCTELFPVTVESSKEVVETNMWKRWSKWKTSRRSRRLRPRRFPPLRRWFPLPPNFPLRLERNP
jgi:hypothetical protein